MRERLQPLRPAPAFTHTHTAQCEISLVFTIYFLYIMSHDKQRPRWDPTCQERDTLGMLGGPALRLILRWHTCYRINLKRHVSGQTHSDVYLYQSFNALCISTLDCVAHLNDRPECRTELGAPGYSLEAVKEKLLLNNMKMKDASVIEIVTMQDVSTLLDCDLFTCVVLMSQLITTF